MQYKLYKPYSESMINKHAGEIYQKVLFFWGMTKHIYIESLVVWRFRRFMFN